MAGRNKHKWRLALALALAALGIGLLTFWRARKPLMERATRVTSAADWSDFFWLSDHRVLYFQPSKRRYATAPFRGRTVPVVDKSDPAAAVLDLQTREETLLPRIAKQFYRIVTPAGLSTGAYLGVGQRRISPDGAWLLWVRNDAGIVGAALDGSRRFVTPPRSSSGVYWMEDSRRWVELIPDRQQQIARAVIHRVGAPGADEKVAVTPAHRLALQNASLWGDGIVTPDGRLLLPDWRRVAGQSTAIIEWNLRARGNPVRRFVVRLPGGFVGSRAIFSPRGDRILWLLDFDERPFLERLPPGLQRWVPASSGPTSGGRWKPHLWISRWDGADLHEIGDLEFRSDIRWMPDGRRLSFLSHGALFTIPVE